MVKVLAIASPPDLDAVASVYLLRRALREEVEVKYLDHSVIDASEADYILDSPHGKVRIKRFDHHDTKEWTCSAMKVAEHFNMGRAERRLAQAVCWQDNAGWRPLGRDGTDNLLDTTLKSLMVAGYAPEEFEKIFKTIFDALITKFEEDDKVVSQIEKNTLYRSENNEVLTIEGDFPKDVIFQEFSPKFLVKVSNRGISVTRTAKLSSPDLNDFKEAVKKFDSKGIGRWFFHPQGFYLSYSADPNKNENVTVDPVFFSKELLSFVTKK
ncbi:MAG: hypothetical protein M1556_08045 [Candidatus Thermoplasmatota archaeon]|jgi:hypothetical protein|nr:hypothetical protein [Candidatus Thermoplasmatota archaeon]MCL6003571.1 hypothetical protein [Candidatus Thermoplasmatota archaeon]